MSSDERIPAAWVDKAEAAVEASLPDGFGWPIDPEGIARAVIHAVRDDIERTARLSMARGLNEVLAYRELADRLRTWGGV